MSAKRVYKRSIEDLKRVASMFWPSELSQKEADISVIPKLLETQEQFITLLSVDVPDIDALYKVIESSRLPANMFLKHLVVLADFGGEMTQRINTEFKHMFPSGKLIFSKNGSEHEYAFKALPVSGTLSNDKLGVSGKKLLDPRVLDDLIKDVIVILLYGSTCSDDRVAEVLGKCEIGNYLGQPDKLRNFIKQRYIVVSRITGGAQSNALGQIAQDFVKDYLTEHLDIKGLSIKRNGTIPGITHTDAATGRLTSFDLVAGKGDKYVAVEVSFQITTNSVIERKAGQAQARYAQIEAAGHKIAYVIDGVGNFQRESAVKVLCSYSHCTVAFSREELDLLCDFIREHLA